MLLMSDKRGALEHDELGGKSMGPEGVYEEIMIDDKTRCR